MLSDRIGAKVRGAQDAPPLSMAEKLLFAFCAAALVFVCLAGSTELDRQGKARAALTQGARPGAVTLLQISEDGYTVEQLLYAEGDMRALYDAETGYTVWRAEQRIRFDRSEGA